LEAADAVADRGLDVVVVDTDSEGWDPLAFLRAAARRRPDLALVAMSADERPELVTAALKAGAVSWVSKQVGVQEMVDVICATSRGESSVPPRLLRDVLRELAGSSAPHGQASVFAGLTDREREILEYAVLGLSRGQIAAELGLSINTVRTHVHHILTKLGTHTMLEAVTLVLRERAAAG